MSSGSAGNQIAWYMKYKPRTIEDIIFPNILNEQPTDPEDIKNMFLSMINPGGSEGGISGNVLAYGPGGFGKSSLLDVVIKELVSHPKDVFMLGKSVNDVNELKSWLQHTKQPNSKQRVVKIEEADKLSKEAQVMLKDGLMEKYQGKITFLAATNHPEKLDKALKTRFNFRLNFKEISPEGALTYVEKILINEGITYDRNKLYEFIQKNIKIGLRDLLNAIQVSVKDNNLDNISLIETSNNNEDYIIQVVDYLIKLFETYDIPKMESVLAYTGNDNTFHQYYTAILNMTKNDPFLEWDYIYKELLEKEFQLDVISTISDEYQEIEKKIFPHQHFISTFIKALYAIYRRKSGKIVFIKSV